MHSAPLERCRGTVAPLAEKLGTRIAPERTFSENAYRDDPAAARRRLVDLAAAQRPGQTTVICSQGGVIPGVVKSLAARDDVQVAEVSTPKAAYWFLSFDARRLVQADPYPPPVV